MSRRVGALVSDRGVPVRAVLPAGAVRAYRSGASAPWIAVGAVALLGATAAPVRDVRRLRARSAG